MMNLDNAYDDFLAGRTDRVPKAIAEYEEKVHESLVKFGRFTVPTFYKAHFVTPEQEKLLKRVTQVTTGVLDKVVNLYFTEPALAPMFHLSDAERQLMQYDPGYSRTVCIARLDSFMDGDDLKLVEFNCDSPAGVAYADLLEEMLCESSLFKEFLQNHAVRHVSRRQHLLDTLLAQYSEFGGGNSKPNIAIVDWRTVRTRPEFEALKIYFEEKGFPTTIVDPRDLEFKNGKLCDGDFKIDIVYRRVIFGELLDKIDECQDLITAYKSRAACVVNPFRSRLAATKAVMSILTNPEFNHFFTDEENEIKERHIPWTRRIVDAEKFYGGRKVYLLDFLKDEKETLVLKPASGYGGTDVVLGCETTNDNWNKAIDKALKGDWVVQECVRIPTMSVPIVINNKLEFVLKKINLNPFALNGRYGGSLSRLSDESIINVSHGGGLVPTLATEEFHQR
ncbi:MAG: circularly permuted type 2 ATP-grasp protein [Candidatus Omnitrophica bacterium]|nr:circularly permuted type 2 ATP-grasp protein [Candidatus Omnitrophota bacterium]